MQIPSEKELRRWRSVDLPPKSDFLLLLVPRGPVNFGQVLSPERLGEFFEGDIVHFTRGKEMLASEAAEEETTTLLVKALPADCQKVSDPKEKEGYKNVLAIVMRG